MGGSYSSVAGVLINRENKDTGAHRGTVMGRHGEKMASSKPKREGSELSALLTS